MLLEDGDLASQKVNRETYQRVHAAYCRAVDHGYSDGFDTFAYNHVSTDCCVTVDGEPVDPDTEGTR